MPTYTVRVPVALFRDDVDLQRFKQAARRINIAVTSAWFVDSGTLQFNTDVALSQGEKTLLKNHLTSLLIVGDVEESVI